MLLTLNYLAFAQTKESDSKDFSKAEKKVLEVLNQWRDAMIARDKKKIGAIFSEDVIITTFDGTTRGKQEELEVILRDDRVKFVSITNEDIRIKIYGKTSVVTALTKMHSRFSGRDFKNEFRFTSVFVQKDERWQMVALHVSTINASGAKIISKAKIKEK